MKTPYLLGIITVLLFGSFAVSGMMAQGGIEDLEVVKESGNYVCWGGPSISAPDCIFDYDLALTIPNIISTATCPASHKLIGGGFEHLGQATTAQTAFPSAKDYLFNQYPNFGSNSWNIELVDGQLGDNAQSVGWQAYAMCAKINFPMNMGSMIGGELLDLDTMALFIGAIGVNPVITGLVGITLAGIVGQTTWFVYRRKKSKNSQI